MQHPAPASPSLARFAKMGPFGGNRHSSAQRRSTGAEWRDGNAISQHGNPSFGICADIARVCANVLPRGLRARGQSVRDHGSAVDQMHSHRLRRGFSKAVRRVLWDCARAPKKPGARPPATHSAHLRGPTSDSPGVRIDESNQGTGRRGDQSMREHVDPKCAVGCFFEDDAGRAEAKRTGLSCPDRQAALAKQCLKRCTNYASDTTHLGCTGSYPNTVWHISFGDISGDTGDSARVDLCGPPLRSIFAKKPPPS